ncbi:MAG: methionine--tRNA ligase [Candidatus Aenigmarchaeota archaeon]|nr:methionine--tRNA ligase [Candidatus Aenigmarchaeota archaeon]
MVLARKKFYITTPIYYVNDVPHIGHAYTTIAADVIARWHRLKGEDVFFLTGTDEHGEKIQQAAEKAGKEPKKFCDEIAKKFKDAWKILNISYNHFIRTTDKYHVKAVINALQTLYKNGYIYKGKYQGLYCVGCEKYLTESELIDGKCPLHLKEPQFLSEDSYFFTLSKFHTVLLNKIEKDEIVIKPEARKNEIISFLQNNKLEDISISRSKVKWGIKLPWDESHTCYVWIDAFLNYVTGIGWPNKKFERYWPADLHLIGKDILRVHATIWPAELLAVGLKVPKQIFAHGYFTIKGQKMSKSLGNVVDPVELSKKYSVDAVRYFLIREFPFGEDGDFSEEALINRINGELVADLGNLIYRVLTLAERYKGRIKGKPELDKILDISLIDKHMENLELQDALGAIWEFVRNTNKYINEKQVWKLEGEELSNALYNLLEACRIISILISPFLPETSEKINKQLGIKAGKLKDCKFRKFTGRIKKGEYLFKKVVKM